MLFRSADDGGGHAADSAFAERRLGNAREHGVGYHWRYDNINGVYAVGAANTVFVVERKIS